MCFPNQSWPWGEIFAPTYRGLWLMPGVLEVLKTTALRSFAERCVFTLSAHSAWLPLPDTRSLLTFQTHLPLLLSMNTKQNKSPWFSTYAPGFLVTGECLCPFFSLLEGAPSHFHLPGEAVMTYSPASTHSPAHWVWCLPPYTSWYIEA